MQICYGTDWPAAALFDSNTASSEALAGRLHQHCPQLIIIVASNDPAGFELIVNATPLGLRAAEAATAAQ